MHGFVSIVLFVSVLWVPLRAQEQAQGQTDTPPPAEASSDSPQDSVVPTDGSKKSLRKGEETGTPPGFAKRIRDTLLEAFNVGGLEFRAHAKVYLDAVNQLDLLLDNPSSTPLEIANACEELATILGETERVIGAVDLAGFDRATNTVFALLKAQQGLDKEKRARYEETRARFAAKPKKELSDVELAACMNAENGVQNTTRRLAHFDTLNTQVNEMRSAVSARNSALQDMAEIHKNLANVYRELAETARIVQSMSEIQSVIARIAEDSRLLQRKIDKAQEHMTRVLERLENTPDERRPSP